MGPNVENLYIDNFGRLISSLGRLASPEQNPTAYQRTAECQNFEDFARRNGYVDENGEPSYKAYEEFGMQAIKDYQASLKNVTMENATILFADAKDTFGGRK